MGVVSCHRLLGVSSFVLEVRSWSGNDVPVNLYQMNVILCPDQKGQSPKAQPSPSKVQVLANSSVSSSFRARFPHPAQLSSLREPGTQPTGPQSPQAAQMGRAGLTDCSLHRWPLLLGWRDRDGAGVHCRLKAWAKLVEGLSGGSGAPWDVVPSLFLGPSSPPAGPRLDKMEGLPGEGLNLPLTSLSSWWSPHHWPSTPSFPQWSLIDSSLWAGPTAVLTNSWAGQLQWLIDRWLLVGGATEAPSNVWARPVA